MNFTLVPCCLTECNKSLCARSATEKEGCLVIAHGMILGFEVVRFG